MEIPFHQYDFNDQEIQAVIETLNSGWLTMGKKTVMFEEQFNSFHGGAGYSIATGSCSFGLQLMVQALLSKQNPSFNNQKEIIVPVNTFYATASAVVHQGIKPVFCDVDKENLLIDINDAISKVNEHTMGLFVVHLGGNMPNMDMLIDQSQSRNIVLLEDCAHAIEAQFAGTPAGRWGIGGCFSFYPNKNITTIEGGMVTTNDDAFAHQIKLLRNHGIDYSSYDRSQLNGGFKQYDIIGHGHKFNMTDIQASLGLIQLAKISSFYNRRVEIVKRYDDAFLQTNMIKRPIIHQLCKSAHHLYIVQLELEKIRITRNQMIDELTTFGIQTSVHYKPLHLMTVFGNQKGKFPNAEYIYERTLSLPLFPKMTDSQVDYVIEKFLYLLKKYAL